MKNFIGCLAFNMTTHESTKGTPDKLFLGRELQSSLLASWDLIFSHSCWVHKREESSNFCTYKVNKPTKRY